MDHLNETLDAFLCYLCPCLYPIQRCICTRFDISWYGIVTHKIFLTISENILTISAKSLSKIPSRC